METKYKKQRMKKISEKIIKKSKLALNKELLISFVNINEFTSYSVNPSDFINRLSSKQRNKGDMYPPYMDHMWIFRNATTKKMCFTYQPNVSMHSDPDDQFQIVKRDAEAWAMERGLKADTYNTVYSWHETGGSYLVIIQLLSSNVQPPEVS